MYDVFRSWNCLLPSRRFVLIENDYKKNFDIFQLNLYDDAEEALTEANFLNNQNAGKRLTNVSE